MRLHKVWTGIIAFVAFFIIVGIINQKPDTATPTLADTSNNEKPAAKETVKQINYQTVSSTDKNGQLTGVYVIDPSNNNTADMTILGTQLSKIAANTDGYYYGYVFDDAQAASYINAVHTGTDTAEQDAVYDPHYVGTYTKNPNSGANRFVITIKGDQDPNPQTINY